MNEAILKKFEARLDRRSFLRGSALAGAALVAMAAAAPIVTFAQTQDKPQDDKKQPARDRDVSELSSFIRSVQRNYSPS